jgi:hypothetical protein
MERAIESENKTIVFEIVTDFEEEVAIVKTEGQEDISSPRKHSPIRSVSERVCCDCIPSLCAPDHSTRHDTPGSVAEVYLLDWRYFKVGLLRDSRLFISKQTDEKGPKNEIDRKVARTSPKDQFVRQMRGALNVLSKEFV